VQGAGCKVKVQGEGEGALGGAELAWSGSQHAAGMHSSDSA
jgi:hypothetical protein